MYIYIICMYVCNCTICDICMYISMDIPSLIIQSCCTLYLCKSIMYRGLFENTYRMYMCGVCVCVCLHVASSVFWVKFKLVIKKSTNLSQPCVPV